MAMLVMLLLIAAVVLVYVFVPMAADRFVRHRQAEIIPLFSDRKARPGAARRRARRAARRPRSRGSGTPTERRA